MVQGKTYKTSSGQYVTKDNILTINKTTVVHASSKEPLEIDWEKMSKSKYNGVDPQEIIDQYGVDFTRMLMLNFVHPRSLRNFTCKYHLCIIILNLRRLFELFVMRFYRLFV